MRLLVKMTNNLERMFDGFAFFDIIVNFYNTFAFYGLKNI